MKQSMLMVGVMSGTSADALDVAIVHIDAQEQVKLRHYQEHVIAADMREVILRLAQPGLNEIDTLGALDRQMAEMVAQAVLDSLYDAGIAPTRVDAIASHGQTIRHRPNGSRAFSLQIACPSSIAHLTGITTVADFRKRDMAAGGQGAPLTPFAHRHLFSQEQDSVVLNIGGISNISWLPQAGEVMGFDCGPGNMLMDALMLALSDGRDCMDKNGELARMGHVQQKLLAELLQHPYFSRQPPKSTGREQFGEQMVNRLLAEPDMSHADRLATACALTVHSIRDAMQWLPAQPKHCFVCGGGVFNAFLMQSLADAMPDMHVQSTEQAGVPPQALEAVSFALFGYLTLQGKNNIYASVTGASQDVVGGVIAPGRNWLGLMQKLCEA